jgi:uncharacterized membrane protein (DUF485 family)
MFHEPAAQHGSDPATAYKTRIGAWMFLLYALVYAAFVAINIMEPLWMKAIVFWGLNLAVVYGFFLIVFALVLALIYTRLCSREEAALAGSASSAPQTVATTKKDA